MGPIVHGTNSPTTMLSNIIFYNTLPPVVIILIVTMHETRNGMRVFHGCNVWNKMPGACIRHDIEFNTLPS